MVHQLTEAEWDALVGLIAESPAERIGHALQRLSGWHGVKTASPPANHLTSRRFTTEAWLIHLASISSGTAFDRALLTELRRLSLH